MYIFHKTKTQTIRRLSWLIFIQQHFHIFILSVFSHLLPLAKKGYSHSKRKIFSEYAEQSLCITQISFFFYKKAYSSFLPFSRFSLNAVPQNSAVVDFFWGNWMSHKRINFSCCIWAWARGCIELARAKNKEKNCFLKL